MWNLSKKKILVNKFRNIISVLNYKNVIYFIKMKNTNRLSINVSSRVNFASVTYNTSTSQRDANSTISPRAKRLMRHTEGHLLPFSLDP